MQAEQSFHYDNFHNEVYNSFVDNNEDLVGMIAYSIYKEKKINFIRELVDKGTDNNQIKQEIESFKSEAISKKGDYFNSAVDTAQKFIDIHYKNVIDDENRATLLAESRKGATKLHLLLMLLWGILIIVGFIVLGSYFYYLRDSNLYKVGTTFKDNREVLFYFLEKYSRRIFIIVATFYGIKILWYNFKLSFHSLIMNTHHADNLRIFDYLKNNDTSDLISQESLKYIFIDNKTDSESKKETDIEQKVLTKMSSKIDSLFDSATDVFKKKASE